MFPKTASVQELQRSYRSIFDDVMENKDFVVIMSNNKPQVVVCDFKSFEAHQKRIQEYELAEARLAIKIANRERKEGKLKKLRSLADLMT